MWQKLRGSDKIVAVTWAIMKQVPEKNQGFVLINTGK